MGRYIFVLGTLDTKGQEVDFLRQEIHAQGGRPLVVDTGVLNEPTVPPDISRQDVAQAGGSCIQALIEGGDKTQALVTMAEGASRLLARYLRRGELAGVVALGGSRGTALGTRVMQTLPVGVPKLMVSTIASGENPFGPYVGTKDVTLMHSVADIMGLNAITRPILRNAAAAIVGMSRTGGPIAAGGKRVLSASVLGVSTTLVSQIQRLMEPETCEVIAFHAVGTGGRAMEELIGSGFIEGVFEVTPGEMVQLHVGGSCSAGPQRMQGAAQQGLPQVFAPGGLDFIIEGALEDLPQRYSGRKIMRHTPTITLVRTSVEEMAAVAKTIAERLSASGGPVAAIFPLQAFGWFGMQGQPLHDPESDRAFVETFKAHCSPNVEVIELDTHLNDPLVGETAVAIMRGMLA